MLENLMPILDLQHFLVRNSINVWQKSVTIFFLKVLTVHIKCF